MEKRCSTIINKLFCTICFAVLLKEDMFPGTLQISAEGTVRKTDFFGKIGPVYLSAFDEVLDTLPGIAGKISIRHSDLHHSSSI